MSVKIKLKRLGKKKNPQYRIVVADSRTARGGRSIEEIGIYQPRNEPSLIQVDSDRAQYWLGVGAQPTEPVMAILKVTGDWQKFKGLPGAEGTLRVAEPKADKQMAFEAAVKSAEEAGKAPKPKAPSLKEAAAAAGANLEQKADGGQGARGREGRGGQGARGREGRGGQGRHRGAQGGQGRC